MSMAATGSLGYARTVRTRGWFAEALLSLLKKPRVMIAGGLLLLVAVPCLVTLPWTLNPSSTWYYDAQYNLPPRLPPSTQSILTIFGTDGFGRSILTRCMVGGVISLAVGLAAACISVVLGVTVGLFAGFKGGWVDSLLMRTVDIMYGLPYVLLIIMLKLALEPPLASVFSPTTANLIVLFAAIGLVSWLTLARVVRGQVLSLRSQPFVEACRAVGLPSTRIFLKHILPNLIGPVTVYATLTIPQAILQEAFLSFLGIGIRPPLPTWGALANENRIAALNTMNPEWWMLAFPCILLALTLLSLNFVGDGLRDLFDPRKEAAKL